MRPRDVALHRLAAQRLVGPRLDAAALVRHLGALQGQDLPGALTSVMLRAGDDGVMAALGDGSVVRSWPMRGTLHLAPAADLGWMLSLTAGRTLDGSRRRREQLGLDAATIDRAERLAVDALSGGHSLARSQLLQLWSDDGLLEVRPRGYHLLFFLSQRAVLCLGPVRGREQHVVLLDEWIREPRRLGREEALAEWARRYFTSHGPATRRDFMWWTKLTGADATAAIEAVRPELASVEVDGVEHLMDPAVPDLFAEHRRRAEGVHLLPGFDEFLLGYQDRGAALPGEHSERVVPGGNGMFRPTVLARGTVVGTWRRAGAGARPRIEAEPFTSFTKAVTAALPKVAEALPRPAVKG